MRGLGFDADGSDFAAGGLPSKGAQEHVLKIQKNVHKRIGGYGPRPFLKPSEGTPPGTKDVRLDPRRPKPGAGGRGFLNPDDDQTKGFAAGETFGKPEDFQPVKIESRSRGSSLPSLGVGGAAPSKPKPKPVGPALGGMLRKPKGAGQLGGTPGSRNASVVAAIQHGLKPSPSIAGRLGAPKMKSKQAQALGEIEGGMAQAKPAGGGVATPSAAAAGRRAPFQPESFMQSLKALPRDAAGGLGQFAGDLDALKNRITQSYGKLAGRGKAMVAKGKAGVASAKGAVGNVAKEYAGGLGDAFQRGYGYTAPPRAAAPPPLPGQRTPQASTPPPLPSQRPPAQVASTGLAGQAQGQRPFDLKNIMSGAVRGDFIRRGMPDKLTPAQVEEMLSTGKVKGFSAPTTRRIVMLDTGERVAI